jgi:hypothetical protein
MAAPVRISDFGRGAAVRLFTVADVWTTEPAMRAEVAAVGRPAFNSTPTESGVTSAYTQFANANGLETRVATVWWGRWAWFGRRFHSGAGISRRQWSKYVPST